MFKHYLTNTFITLNHCGINISFENILNNMKGLVLTIPGVTLQSVDDVETKPHDLELYTEMWKYLYDFKTHTTTDLYFEMIIPQIVYKNLKDFNRI